MTNKWFCGATGEGLPVPPAMHEIESGTLKFLRITLFSTLELHDIRILFSSFHSFSIFVVNSFFLMSYSLFPNVFM